MGIIKIPKEAAHKFQMNVSEIFETGNLAEGYWNAKLADYTKSYTRAHFAVPFASNGSGLLAILLLLKRYRNYKNIFIQANTMYGVKTIALTSGLNYLGAATCCISSLMPSLEQVKEFVGKLEEPEKTVFLLTHIGGIVNPDIKAIALFCKDVGIALVEDCAHSFGSTLDGEHTGLFGIAGAYSLYATKAIAAGEGGIVVTNDSDLGSMLGKFNIYDRFEQVQEIGVNFRVSEIQALFSYCMCEMSEAIIHNKDKIAQYYIEACNQAGIEIINPYKAGQKGNHYKFTIIAEFDADAEFKCITNRTSPVYNYRLGEDPMSIATRHICLPIWYDLETEVVEQTVDQLVSLNAA